MLYSGIPVNFDQSVLFQNCASIQSERSVPAMISLLKVESHLHGIKFSPHKEISEHSYSLWLLRERIPTVILNVNVPCKLEDYLKQKTVRIRERRRHGRQIIHSIDF